MQFEDVHLEMSGYFSFHENSNCESTDTLGATVDAFIEMGNLIKKNFMMKPEKLAQF